MIAEFTASIVSVIDEATNARIQTALAQALLSTRRSPGRPPRALSPKQLCPVPGCKNVAAPVFGMVCAAHKEVPKAKIKEYRARRRADKGKR